jgi:hypothetical protein
MILSFYLVSKSLQGNLTPPPPECQVFFQKKFFKKGWWLFSRGLVAKILDIHEVLMLLFGVRVSGARWGIKICVFVA